MKLKQWTLMKQTANDGGGITGCKSLGSCFSESEMKAKAFFRKMLGVKFSGKCSPYFLRENA